MQQRYCSPLSVRIPATSGEFEGRGRRGGEIFLIPATSGGVGEGKGNTDPDSGLRGQPLIGVPSFIVRLEILLPD